MTELETQIFGEKITAKHPQHAERIEALLPFTIYGPTYHRGVNETLHNVYDRCPNDRAADYWVMVAELKAGFVTIEEFLAATKGA